MPETKPKIYFVEGKEVHMVGDYVGVCWNLDAENNREGDPYINFVWIRENDGKVWEDEDSSIAGGIDFELAMKLVDELQSALDYATQLGITKSPKELGL